jgi:hypothetical protein
VRPAEGQEDRPVLDLRHRRVGRVAIHDQDAFLDRPEVLLGHFMRAARGEHEDHHVSGMKDPEIPAVADLAFAGDEDQPAGLVGMPQRLLLAVGHQLVVHRLEQGQEPLQAVGQRAL